MTKKRKKRNIYSISLKAIALVASVVFFVVLLEIGVRLLFPDLLQSRPCYQYHPTRYWTLRPNSSVTSYFRGPDGRIDWDFTLSVSEQGLRDRTYGPKEPNEFRILLLGDSMVLGRGVHESKTIPKRLESLFTEHYDELVVSVINGGISMYCPWQSRDLFNEIGPSLEPDMVILGVFTGNDVMDTLSRHGMQQMAYRPGFYSQYTLLRNQRQWNYFIEYQMRRHWQTLNACTQFLGWFELCSIAHALGVLSCRADDSLLDLSPPANRNPLIELDLACWYPELQTGYDYMWQDIKGLKKDCDAHHIDFHVFAMPPAEIVYDTMWHAATERTEKRYERGKIARLMSETAQELSISWIPVIEALLNIDQKQWLYIPHDGHLNEEGCLFVAEELFEWLSAHYPDHQFSER